MRSKNGRVKRLGGFAVVGTVLMLLSAGSASAGSTPDGGSGAGTAGETVVNTLCNGDVSTRALTEDAATSMTGSAFVTHQAMAVSVPSGTTRCLLVQFNAETACSGDPGTHDDFCYVRALDNGVEMNPVSGGFTAFQSEDPTAESNSHRWIRRVGAGTHTISIQRRTDGGTTAFHLDDSMLTVTVLA